MATLHMVPAEAVDIEEVLRRFPTVRQSLLSKYDDCPLSTYFETRYSRGWSTHPQARGTIFHRFAAACLRTMREYGHESIPVAEALAILLEVSRQQDVPPEDIVRVPLRQMPELRMAATKFAKDNSFSVSKIVDIEKRISAPLTYIDANGQQITRMLTGQLDALLFDPPDGAIVIDWKDTWGLPPEPKEKDAAAFVGEDDELKGISYHGFFQQRFYGWLVMMEYSNVQRVTLREFYARKTKVRKATLLRSQLDTVEDELRVLIEAFDCAVKQGSPEALLKGDEDGYVDIEALGWWKPQPGKHCGFCPRIAACPIEEETRESAGGATTSPKRAALWAARYEVATNIRKKAVEVCKGYVETSGQPIPLRWSKGRRVLGWFTKGGGGRSFGPYTPDDSDRGGHPVDVQLAEAMRSATARAREERGIKPRREAKRRKRSGKA